MPDRVLTVSVQSQVTEEVMKATIQKALDIAGMCLSFSHILCSSMSALCACSFSSRQESTRARLFIVWLLFVPQWNWHSNQTLLPGMNPYILLWNWCMAMLMFVFNLSMQRRLFCYQGTWTRKFWVARISFATSNSATLHRVQTQYESFTTDWYSSQLWFLCSLHYRISEDLIQRALHTQRAQIDYLKAMALKLEKLFEVVLLARVCNDMPLHCLTIFSFIHVCSFCFSTGLTMPVNKLRGVLFCWILSAQFFRPESARSIPWQRGWETNTTSIWYVKSTLLYSNSYPTFKYSTFCIFIVFYFQYVKFFIEQMLSIQDCPFTIFSDKSKRFGLTVNVISRYEDGDHKMSSIVSYFVEI